MRERAWWKEAAAYQIYPKSFYDSDGAAVMQADIPARCTHTPFETGHLGDIEALTDWMCACVRKGLAGV